MNAWIFATLLLMTPPREPLPTYDTGRTETGSERLLAGGEAAWSEAARIGWGEPPYRTDFRALASPTTLWMRWDARDDSPWHTLTERDDPIWREEVVEVFLDPDGDGRDYVEIEISPAGVVTDLLVARGAPEPSADIDWDVRGLLSRVLHTENGWTAIVGLPWASLAGVPGATGAAPEAGERWRFNVFRIKRPHGPEQPGRDVSLAAWSPVPGPSFHVPEVFGWMRFVE